MLSIDSIESGIVIDHITAGNAMLIYRSLNLETVDSAVAIIKNVKSSKHGKKDIIKIEDRTDIDFTLLGYIDPGVTVNIIENGRISDKKHLALPERITNITKCKNPRCITGVETDIEHTFVLVDREKRVYRCVYCQQER